MIYLKNVFSLLIKREIKLIRYIWYVKLHGKGCQIKSNIKASLYFVHIDMNYKCSKNYVKFLDVYMFCNEVLSVIKTETHTKGTEPQYQGNELTVTQRHEHQNLCRFWHM